MKKSIIVTKKHIILSVLVFALAAAVYLNWEFSSPMIQSDNEGTSSYLGAAEYVNATVTEESGDDTIKYFTETRSSREKTKNDRIKILNETIDNVKSTKEQINSAIEEKNKISKCAELESNIDAMIKAKGFNECVTIISDDKATVVVATKGLLASQTVQIQDIVSGQTNFSLENIKIIEIN